MGGISIVVTARPRKVSSISISNPPPNGKEIVNIYWDAVTEEIVIITKD